MEQLWRKWLEAALAWRGPEDYLQAHKVLDLRVGVEDRGAEGGAAGRAQLRRIWAVRGRAQDAL